jgi:transposase
MYVKHCKLTRYQQLRLMEHFVAGTPARTAADLLGVHRNSAIRFFHKLRCAIASKQQNRAAQFCGEIEIDESYFGGVRKGKRGRGAAGKVIVFGLLKRGGKVYTLPVENVKRDTLLPVIQRKVRPDSVVYTDGHTAYNALDVSEFTHFRINHSREFVDKHNHINGIENFWNQAKRHLRKYNGIPKQNFELFLKECEWRFNEGSPKQLLEDLKIILKEQY